MSVRDDGDLLVTRGVATELATGAGLTAAGQERVSLIVAELGCNLRRHTPDGGTILMRAAEGGRAWECICADRGPGIDDLAACLRDERTGAASLGVGLGAVRRLSDTFDIHSQVGAGTAILARVREGDPPPSERFRAGAAMLPMSGMEACGDGWVVTADGLVALIDGLGHGPEAALAARRAEDCAASGYDDPRRCIDAMHVALRGTRGAVVMVVQLGDQAVRYAGIGNIAASVIGIDRIAGLHSSWGVVGSNIVADTGPREAPWQPGDVLMLNSDGVTKATDVFASRHLRYVEPTLACAIVLRDAATKLDDQTVVIVQR